jgi:hypothetical protein
MPDKNISIKFKTETAKRFRNSFKEDSNRQVGYVFIGKTKEHTNELVPDDIIDTVSEEKDVWNNMYAAKKVSASDIEFVISNLQWVSGRKYKQFDDRANMEFLLTETNSGSETIYPMYIVYDNSVYKCLCNNVSTASTIPPTGNYSENNGFISTLDAGPGQTGYLWKYMYSLRPSNKFVTNDWIPVPYEMSDLNTVDYDMNQENLIDGGLNKIIVVNRGSGYYNTTLNVNPFITNSSNIRVSDNIFFPTSNVRVNMEVSGVGILQGTYITSLDPQNRIIFLSNPTVSAGGGTTSNNRISILTRVEVQGDGSDLLTSVRLNVSSQVEKIDVVNTGLGYTRANLIIYGSGTGATARAVLPPKFGHGYNPAMELGARDIMISQRIGETNDSENSIIPTDTKIRQYGLLLNPYKYSEDSHVTDQNANTVITMTTDVTLLGGLAYPQNEIVYQGNPLNPSFRGNVVSQTDFTVKLNDVYGTITLGSSLNGSNSGISRPVISSKNPEFKPYAGDIVFTKNIIAVERSEGQAEEVKLIFKF